MILPPTQLPKLRGDFNISKEVRGPASLIKEIQLDLREYKLSPFIFSGDLSEWAKENAMSN